MGRFMLKKSIILTGMPGSGKSTVGKLLAEKLQLPFCDTDDLIIKKTGEALQDIIDERGRDAFLKEEHDVLMELKGDPVSVIATGGSVILHEDAIEHLKTIGTIVFLDADLPLIRKRLWNMDHRGIVFGKDDNDIFNVYKEREPLYYKHSDIRVHIRNKRVREIVEEILKQI